MCQKLQYFQLEHKCQSNMQYFQCDKKLGENDHFPKTKKEYKRVKVSEMRESVPKLSLFSRRNNLVKILPILSIKMKCLTKLREFHYQGKV